MIFIYNTEWKKSHKNPYFSLTFWFILLELILKTVKFPNTLSLNFYLICFRAFYYFEKKNEVNLKNLLYKKTNLLYAWGY